jgi:glycosyltransferase involved in cell wall biosynthesis
LNLSIVIFCFNEHRSIERVISEARLFLINAAINYEIIVIDDGSTDRTPEILKQLSFYANDISVITHPKNMGIGMALKTGYQNASKEYVCAIPGDGQFDINELSDIRDFSNNIFYSFYRPQTGYNLYRSTLTWLNRFFNQHVLGIFLRDVNWIKVYRREQIEIVKPKLTSSLIESEICAKLFKLGATPIEIPSKYLERKHGISTGGSWRTLKKALADLAVLWWEVMRFRYSNRN